MTEFLHVIDQRWRQHYTGDRTWYRTWYGCSNCTTQHYAGDYWLLWSARCVLFYHRLRRRHSNEFRWSNLLYFSCAAAAAAAADDDDDDDAIIIRSLLQQLSWTFRGEQRCTDREILTGRKRMRA